MNYSMHVSTYTALLVLLLVPIVSFAAEFRVGEQPSFPAGETVVDDLYMVGGNVTAGGAVRGDLSAVGGNLLLNSAVQSDLAALGGSVTILGDVNDDVRVVGGDIIIQGKVSGDVIVGGGQVNIGGSGVAGDIVSGAGVLRLEAPVGGNVKIGAGDVYINSSIVGNVDIKAEKIKLGPNAVIGGDFTYTSPEEAVIEEGAVIRGETVFTESPDVKGAAKAGVATLLSLWFIAKFFMIFAGALAVALIFRRYAQTLVRIATEESLFEIGRGLVFLIVVPVISTLLFFTVIGIPFGLLGLILFAGVLVFVSISAPILIGSVVHRWIFKTPEYEISWKTVLTGALIYSLLGLIPIIGWLIKLGIILLTLGAVLNIKWGIIKEWR